jgi:hypothetical protein
MKVYVLIADEGSMQMEWSANHVIKGVFSSLELAQNAEQKLKLGDFSTVEEKNAYTTAMQEAEAFNRALDVQERKALKDFSEEHQLHLAFHWTKEIQELKNELLKSFKSQRKAVQKDRMYLCDTWIEEHELI